MALQVAQQYVEAFGKLAKETNTMLLPASTNDPAAMVAQVRPPVDNNSVLVYRVGFRPVRFLSKAGVGGWILVAASRLSRAAQPVQQRKQPSPKPTM